MKKLIEQMKFYGRHYPFLELAAEFMLLMLPFVIAYLAVSVEQTNGLSVMFRMTDWSLVALVLCITTLFQLFRATENPQCPFSSAQTRFLFMIVVFAIVANAVVFYAATKAALIAKGSVDDRTIQVWQITGFGCSVFQYFVLGGFSAAFARAGKRP
ncbi:MAG: hypothetical protein F9K30_24040 [Dechloromonas sp.]|nr:MAG: hypothetical protein F9K30_24040 [Dechloromonas sp.]